MSTCTAFSHPWFLTGVRCAPWKLSEGPRLAPCCKPHAREPFKERGPGVQTSRLPPRPSRTTAQGKEWTEGEYYLPPCLPVLSSLSASSFSYPSTCFLPLLLPLLLPRTGNSPGRECKSSAPSTVIGVLSPRLRASQMLPLPLGPSWAPPHLVLLSLSTSGAEEERAEQHAGTLPPEAPHPARRPRSLQLTVPAGSHTGTGILSHPQTGETN